MISVRVNSFYKFGRRSFSVLTQSALTSGLNSEQQQLQSLARDFAENELKPYAKEWDEKKIFPYETLKNAASLGLGGIFVSEEFEGSGLTRFDGAVIFEELAAGCTSTTAFLTIHNMCCWMVNTFANHDLKSKFLPDLVKFSKVSSYCLTEPSNGSDAGNLKLKAEESGDYFVLNGSKAFISGGGTSDVYIVMARTSNDGPKGISCFLVEKGSEGLSFGKNEAKLGWNSQPTSAVIFENCKVPKENMIGNLGEGFKIAMQGLQGGRINIGACSIGAGRACLDIATEHVKSRNQFGKPLSSFQNVQFKLADISTKLHLGRLSIRDAARLLDAGQYKEANVLCALAKKVATDAGFEACNESLQLLGGYGYLRDFPVERYLRDARVHQILEGTNEIMSILLARDVLSE